jgi:hypothetical protein
MKPETEQRETLQFIRKATLTEDSMKKLKQIIKLGLLLSAAISVSTCFCFL